MLLHSAVAAVWPKAKCPIVQSRERRQSMFQLRQYFRFRQELPATQEILSGAELQPKQKGQGQETNGARHVEVHLDGRPARFGRPRGSAGPTWSPLVLIFLRESDLWAHVKILWCICLGSPVCSYMWALLVSDMFQCGSFVHFSSCSLVFSLFYRCGCL